MNQTNPSVQAGIVKYLELSRNYAHECRNIADTLTMIHSDNDSLAEKLISSANDSYQLADEISKVLELAQNTPQDTWLEVNLVTAMNDFLSLSRIYLEMRKEFIELLTDPKSSTIGIIGGLRDGDELDEKQKVNLVMSYMRDKRDSDGNRKWSNQKIGNFFNLEPNSVVNRLTSSKIENQATSNLGGLASFLKEQGLSVPRSQENNFVISLNTKTGKSIQLIYIGEPSTNKVEMRRKAFIIEKNLIVESPDSINKIAMLYKGGFLFVPSSYFSDVLNEISGRERDNQSSIATAFDVAQETMISEFDNGRNSFELYELY